MQIRNLEDFITQMPKDLESTMEKARWLYIELGKRSFYDVSYKYLNEDDAYVLDKAELHALHVQMIQKHQREIEFLKKEFTSLEQKVNQLIN